jgi:hypothetical protein
MEKLEKKIFWASFAVLGVVADLFLPFWWAVAATIPIIAISWWLASRSSYL